jgi:hypothetical protein
VPSFAHRFRFGRTSGGELARAVALLHCAKGTSEHRFSGA